METEKVEIGVVKGESASQGRAGLSIEIHAERAQAEVWGALGRRMNLPAAWTEARKPLTPGSAK